MYLILLGAPGAGKGTQADILTRELGVVHIASGDLFRDAQAKGTELGLLAKSYMEKGMLVPNEITIKMILERLDTYKPEQSFLFDGFPRTIEQAKALDKVLKERRKAVDRVIYIKVLPQELISRLSGRWICKKCQTPYHEVNSPPKVKGKCDKCGGELYQRADDTPETVKKRIDVYLKETAPLIDYYKKAGKLLEVNGQGEVNTIASDIVAALRAKK